MGRFVDLGRFAVVGLVCLCSCGGPAVSRGPVSALPSVEEEGAAPVQVDAPATTTSLIANAPLRASLDLSASERWLAYVASQFGASDLAFFEHALELPAGSIASGSFLAMCGLDTSRSASAALAPLDPGLQPVVDGLDSMVRRLPPSGPLSDADDRTVGDVWRGRSGLDVWLRFVLPAQDPGRVVRTLQAILALNRWQSSVAPPPGVDVIRVEGSDRVAVALSHAGDAVVIDLWADLAPEPSITVPASTPATVFPSRAVAALTRLRERAFRGPAAPPPALDGATLRLEGEPAALARLGFLHGMAQVQQAVGGGSIDPSMVRALRGQGLREAHRVIELADGGTGPYFSRVTVSVGGRPNAITAEMRAELGPGAPLGAAASRPAPAMELDPQALGADVTTAWLEGFHVPGVNPSGGVAGQRSGEGFVRMVQEGGFWAHLVAMPFFWGAWPSFLIARDAPAVLASPAVLARFERVGIVGHGRSAHAVGFGVLPAGTSRGQAAQAARALGRVTTRIVPLADRLVVLAADEPSALATVSALRPAATTDVTTRVQFGLDEIDAEQLAPVLGTEPLRATANLDGTSLRVSLQIGGP